MRSHIFFPIQILRCISLPEAHDNVQRKMNIVTSCELSPEKAVQMCFYCHEHYLCVCHLPPILFYLALLHIRAI